MSRTAVEAPVCTCITGRAFGFRVLRVLDPFCQFPTHREAADYGIEPNYQ